MKYKSYLSWLPKWICETMEGCMQAVALLIIILLMATSCSRKTQEKIGLVASPPDEYQVHRGKLLEVPPHYNLPTPTTPAGNTLKNEEVIQKLKEEERALLRDINDK